MMIKQSTFSYASYETMGIWALEYSRLSSCSKGSAIGEKKQKGYFIKNTSIKLPQNYGYNMLQPQKLVWSGMVYLNLRFLCEPPTHLIIGIDGTLVRFGGIPEALNHIHNIWGP